VKERRAKGFALDAWDGPRSHQQRSIIITLMGEHIQSVALYIISGMVAW